MGEAIAIGGLAAVMLLSLPLALGLEWLCLRGAFLLLPASPRGALGDTGGSARLHRELARLALTPGCAKLPVPEAAQGPGRMQAQSDGHEQPGL